MTAGSQATQRADVIVVGAGPGGSSAAYHLAQAGLDVALLEKTAFPREKVCGDGLTPRAVRALVGMGIPEYEAKRYEGRIKEGGILLSVHCDNSDWKKKAKDLLKQTGADDVSSTGEAAADYAESDKPVARGTSTV